MKTLSKFETSSDDEKVEGDLRRELAMNIKRLIDIGSYRGLRHKAHLPARVQIPDECADSQGTPEAHREEKVKEECT